MFFEDQIDIISSWEAFQKIEDIQSFLWDYNSGLDIEKFDTELVKSDYTSSDPDLILYFSRLTHNIVVADIIWAKEKNYLVSGYKRAPLFGRSLRYLLEVNESGEVINSVSTIVHHN